jgi:hypothetical protein
MKDKINIVVKTKKIEACATAIVSLILLISGGFFAISMRSYFHETDIVLSPTQIFLMIYSQPLAGIFGLLISGWQYQSARDIEKAD